MTHLADTPGARLEEWLRNTGTSEFTVEALTEDCYIAPGEIDLGNGNYAYPFTSQMTDGVHATPGNEIDLAACNFSDWSNLSSQFTGQYGAPDCMHDSEYMGGSLTEFVANFPAEYATPLISWDCAEDCEDCAGSMVNDSGVYCEPEYEGWLILQREIFN